VGWIKDNKDAWSRYRQAKDKYYTAQAYLNNAELGGNAEAQAAAEQDRKQAVEDIRRTRGQFIWGNLYKG